MCENNKIHCFEKAGLGLAPFTYVGMKYQEISYGMANVQVKGADGSILTLQTKPGGTCDYCGTYIINMFRVRSADNKEFIVGCDCIKKTGDAGLVRQISKDVAAMEKKRRDARKVAKRSEAVELFEANREKLAAKPHPNAYFAGQGKTLADYYAFIAERGNLASYLPALKKLIAE